MIFNRPARFASAWLPAPFLLCTLAACAPRATVTLDQPHAPLSQRRLELSSDWSYTLSGGGAREVLLDFPLPGRKDGPRDFRLFVQLPDDQPVAHTVRSDPSAARGFFLQEVGRMRGKTEFTGGTVRASRVFLQPGRRRIDLHLECDDGTRITGRALVEENSEELSSFRRKFAADVLALHAESQPTQPSAAPTASRPAPAP
ncbi:MAG: hypothetical protein HRF50_12250 [Phycisphaerae bacterium]|jgi:hypothetical protein